MVPEQFQYVVLKHSKLTFPGNLYHHRDKQEREKGDCSIKGSELSK